MSLQELSDLKAQLKLAIAAVEAREQKLTDTLRPKSVHEIEQLETKLSEAIEELRAQKAALKH